VDESRQPVLCPMCGMEFARTDTACAHGCPLGSSCRSLRCPSCEYEFPDRSKAVSRLRSWFHRFRRAPRPANGTALSLDRLTAGERARVVRLTTEDPRRRNTLTVFGLVPGAEVDLIQRRPTYVIRVGETELGLDREIAGEIVVRLD